MNQEKMTTDNWMAVTSELLKSYRDWLSIRIAEYVSLNISITIIGTLALVLATVALLFIGLGFAWWMGEHFGNMKVGFFIMAGLYTFFLTIILLISRKTLLPYIRNHVIKKMYEKD